MLGSGELAQESNRTRKIVVILLRDSKGRDFSSAQPVEEVFRILGDMIVDRFLLAPHGPTTCVVLRYLDEDLHEHGPPLEVRGRWFGSIGEDSMQVVVIDDDGKRLRLFELGEDALLETKAPPLPAAVIADSVVLSDAVVFLGCHSDESEAHLQREKLFRWTCALPTRTGRARRCGTTATTSSRARRSTSCSSTATGCWRSTTSCSRATR
jgi:hypothetical protein